MSLSSLPQPTAGSLPGEQSVDTSFITLSRTLLALGQQHCSKGEKRRFSFHCGCLQGSLHALALSLIPETPEVAVGLCQWLIVLEPNWKVRNRVVEKSSGHSRGVRVARCVAREPHM
jgi:hypothetical protein